MAIAFPAVVLAALALQANSPAPSVADAPKPSSGPATNGHPSAEALAMAQAAQPADVVIGVAERMVTKDMATALFKQPDWVELEKAHPGVTAATTQAFADVIRKDLTDNMHDYHRRYARFYATYFTNDEMAELARFYNSQTGRKLLEAKMANMDGEPLMSGIVADPNQKIRTVDVQQVHTDSTKKAVAEMSAADGQQILKMVRPATLMKMKIMAPAMVKFETDMANEPDPELDAAFDKAMNSVLKQFGVGN